MEVNPRGGSQSTARQTPRAALVTEERDSHPTEPGRACPLPAAHRTKSSITEANPRATLHRNHDLQG